MCVFEEKIIVQIMCDIAILIGNYFNADAIFINQMDTRGACTTGIVDRMIAIFYFNGNDIKPVNGREQICVTTSMNKNNRVLHAVVGLNARARARLQLNRIYRPLSRAMRLLFVILRVRIHWSLVQAAIKYACV